MECRKENIIRSATEERKHDIIMLHTGDPFCNKKNKRFRVRGYQCSRTDSEGDKGKGRGFNTKTIKYKCLHV